MPENVLNGAIANDQREPRALFRKNFEPTLDAARARPASKALIPANRSTQKMDREQRTRIASVPFMFPRVEESVRGEKLDGESCPQSWASICHG